MLGLYITGRYILYIYNIYTYIYTHDLHHLVADALHAMGERGPTSGPTYCPVAKFTGSKHPDTLLDDGACLNVEDIFPAETAWFRLALALVVLGVLVLFGWRLRDIGLRTTLARSTGVGPTVLIALFSGMTFALAQYVFIFTPHLDLKTAHGTENVMIFGRLVHDLLAVSCAMALTGHADAPARLKAVDPALAGGVVLVTVESPHMWMVFDWVETHSPTSAARAIAIHLLKLALLTSTGCAWAIYRFNERRRRVATSIFLVMLFAVFAESLWSHSSPSLVMHPALRAQTRTWFFQGVGEVCYVLIFALTLELTADNVRHQLGSASVDREYSGVERWRLPTMQSARALKRWLPSVSILLPGATVMVVMIAIWAHKLASDVIKPSDADALRPSKRSALPVQVQETGAMRSLLSTLHPNELGSRWGHVPARVPYMIAYLIPFLVALVVQQERFSLKKRRVHGERRGCPIKTSCSYKYPHALINR